MRKWDGDVLLPEIALRGRQEAVREGERYFSALFAHGEEGRAPGTGTDEGGGVELRGELRFDKFGALEFNFPDLKSEFNREEGEVDE